MAVELEKIAALLEEAHESIDTLEAEKVALQDANSALENKLTLQKEASFNNDSWGDSSEMGSAVDYFTPENASPESKLDDFLSH